MLGLIILGSLIVLSVISFAYGVDSRDSSSDHRGPIYPVGLR